MDSGFLDLWNPTVGEVRRWAFDMNSSWPDQDWDLALLWRGFEATYAALAADEDCPKRDFFLHVLYLHVGDAVRSEFASASRSDVEDLLKATADSRSDRVQLWRQRSLHLLANPRSFNYSQWCLGGLARKAT